MNIFDIMGPIMVGPSSSHTAGAARIGFLTRRLLGSTPRRAELLLHGSFAATGTGHGTDRALVAGLLGMRPDDARLPRSFELAEAAGMELTLGRAALRGAHPNTVLLRVEDAAGKRLEVPASSLGGGCAPSTGWRPASPASCPPLSSATRTGPAWWRRSPACCPSGR